MRIAFLFLGFILGMLIMTLSFIFIQSSEIEQPFSISFPLFSFLNNSNEKPSPSDFIKQNQIEIYKDKVIIWVKDASISSYEDTNSMDPVIDKEANGIEVPVKSTEELNVGDIIAFKLGDKLIVHRIIEIGYDDKGWYCITKGDNNPIDDGKIRISQIKFKTIGILW